MANIFELTLWLWWIGVIWVRHRICWRRCRVLLLLSVLWSGRCLLALRSDCCHWFWSIATSSWVGLRILVNWLLSLVVMMGRTLRAIALNYLGRCQVRRRQLTAMVMHTRLWGWGTRQMKVRVNWLILSMRGILTLGLGLEVRICCILQ